MNAHGLGVELPGYRFLLVCEVIKEKSYDRGNQIHVVTNEKDMRIRFYLIEK